MTHSRKKMSDLIQIRLFSYEQRGRRRDVVGAVDGGKVGRVGGGVSGR